MERPIPNGATFLGSALARPPALGQARRSRTGPLQPRVTAAANWASSSTSARLSGVGMPTEFVRAVSREGLLERARSCHAVTGLSASVRAADEQVTRRR